MNVVILLFNFDVSNAAEWFWFVNRGGDIQMGVVISKYLPPKCDCLAPQCSGIGNIKAGNVVFVILGACQMHYSWRHQIGRSYVWKQLIARRGVSIKEFFFGLMAVKML